MSTMTFSFSLLSILAFSVLTGCSTSPPTRLYLIEPIRVSERPKESKPLRIGIGPIQLAEHLNRKEILTQDKRYRINAAEFDRWAEPLDDNITAALAENLSLLIPTESVLAYKWDLGYPVDYRVRVNILSFGSEPSGEIVLSAFWVIQDAGGSSVKLRKSRYSERRNGDDMVSIVAAMSRTIEQLSRDIASALAAVSVEVSESITQLSGNDSQ